MIRAWLAGRAVAAVLAKALDAGVVRRVSVRDESPAGYYAARRLGDARYPFEITQNTIEFSKRERP